MADRSANAIVAQRIEVSPDLIKLRVVPEDWELPDFIPGQFCTLGLPGTSSRHVSADPEEHPPKDPDKTIMRAYSVASSSVAKEYLEFYVGMVRSGSLSPRLFNLKTGDQLYVSPRFKGMFTLSEVPEQFNAVLIATGTGVAPYISMIRTELTSGLKRRFAVFHGAYHSYDLGYHSELSTLSAAIDKFDYYPTLTHAHEEKLPWKGHTGFVQKLWQDGLLEQRWGKKPTPKNTHVFLCGNPFMIEEMIALLEAEGFEQYSKKYPEGQIHSEQFFVKND